MTATRQLTRTEILALPPVITLATLAMCLGVSEPTVRALNRSGELAALNIRVNRLGAQYRIVTATVWAYLGLEHTQQTDTTSRPRPLRPARESGSAA
jgi:hypothetical protein